MLKDIEVKRQLVHIQDIHNITEFSLYHKIDFMISFAILFARIELVNLIDSNNSFS